MFFKDIEDYQKYVPVNAGFDLPQIKIYLDDVDTTIFKKRYLGKPFLAALQAAFDAKETFDLLEEPYKELIDLIRRCSANFALAKWLPIGQVQISQSGVRLQTNDENKTAWEWQIKDIDRICNEVGYNALEDALAFLESNIDAVEFAAYKTSDEFKANNYLFVPSSSEFCKYFSVMENSRINFYKLRSVLRNVEDFDIKGVILPDLFGDLKTKLQAGETLGTNAQRVVDMIKPALVNITVAKAIGVLAISINAEGILTFDNSSSNETVSYKQAGDNSLSRLAKSCMKDGRNYLKILKDYLEANKADYPLYSGDALYVAPTAGVEVNDGTKPFYFGG